MDEELMDMLRQAAFDSVVECPNCGSNMEPDAEKCGGCGFDDTLRNNGLI
jgi:ribosomal protein L40E